MKRVTCGYDSNFENVTISIHTLCEEGDGKTYSVIEHYLISIHTLCEEGDVLFLVIIHKKHIFQSTPSVKRVTTYIVNIFN